MANAYLSHPDYGPKSQKLHLHHEDHHHLDDETPECSWIYKHLHGNASFMCLDDDDYPLYDIENALFYHYFSVNAMYKVIY